MSRQKETLQERLRSTTQRMAGNSSCPIKLWDEHSNNCLQAASALDAAEARIKELEKALKPFAKIKEIKILADDDHYMGSATGQSLKAGDFRRARTALKGAQSNE